MGEITLATCVSRVTAVQEMTAAFQKGDIRRSDRIADYIHRMSSNDSGDGTYTSLLPLHKSDKALFDRKLRIYIHIEER